MAVARDELLADISVTVIAALCIKELKEHLELTTKDPSCKEVLHERRRKTFGTHLQAIEIDSQQNMEHWEGGERQEHYADTYPEEISKKPKGQGTGKGFPDHGEKARSGTSQRRPQRPWIQGQGRG